MAEYKNIKGASELYAFLQRFPTEMETKVMRDLLGDTVDQTLEGKLAHQQIRGLLIPPDLLEGYRAWAVAVGLLHTTNDG